MSQSVALITGAAKRLGANTAVRLHQQGYTVVIHCNHSVEQANKLGISEHIEDVSVPTQNIVEVKRGVRVNS